MRRITLVLLILLVLSGCRESSQEGDAGGASGAGDTGSAGAIVTAFRNAGLEIQGERAMKPEDYGDAPKLCTGTLFLVPSLGANKGGHVFVCERREEMLSIKTFYNVRGQGNPELRSWTFSKDNVLLQIDGSMPRDKAKLYEAALP